MVHAASNLKILTALQYLESECAAPWEFRYSSTREIKDFFDASRLGVIDPSKFADSQRY